MPRSTPWKPVAALAALLCMALASTFARAAGPEAYRLDPVHTRVVLAVDHAGFSSAVGTVSGSTGTLRYDPEDWSSASIEAEVPLARLDFGDDDWNRAVLGARMLDVEDHPVARFTSTRIEALEADRARVHGVLALHGVEREIVLDVKLNARKRHPMPPFRRTLGFSASTTLSRADFGLDAWKSMVGDAIELHIEGEATRARGADDDDDASTAAGEPGT